MFVSTQIRIDTFIAFAHKRVQVDDTCYNSEKHVHIYYGLPPFSSLSNFFDGPCQMQNFMSTKMSQNV